MTLRSWRKGAFGFGPSSLIEQLFGEDILGDEDDGAAKGADDTEEVSRKLNTTSQDNAEGERYEREIGRCRIVDVEDEAVGQNREERGEAFDGMNKRDWDLFGSCRGENVTTNLEHGQRKGCLDDITARIPNAVL